VHPPGATFALAPPGGAVVAILLDAEMQPLVETQSPAAIPDTVVLVLTCARRAAAMVVTVLTRACRAAAVGAIVAGGLFLTACDSFFGVRGQVTDCVSLAPLAAVDIDVHVERGYRDRVESLPNEATTDPNGHYEFDINDPSDSWATLTFHREGYLSLMPPQYQGHSERDPPVNVCLNQAATP